MLTATAKECYDRGAACYQRGDLAAAEEAFTSALALEPAFVEAFTSRGAIRYACGDIAGALADFDAALRLNPRHAEALANRGSIRHKRGDYRAALADFDEAIRLSPSTALFYNNRGATRLLLKDFFAARADFDKAIEIDPQYCAAYIGRGNARYHIQDPEGFLDYRKAFSIDPVRAASTLIRLIVEDIRTNSDVLADCERHLARNPNDFLASARRGLTLLLLGREAEAHRDFQEFIDRNPAGQRNLERLIEEARRVGPALNTQP
jgi:tetratricopeptide (TPR) repeat protein